MNSDNDTAEAVGFPIRKFTDHSLLAAPRDLSQRATSFIASQCQGIHQMPLRRLILEAVDCATRRNKPARDLSRRKMLHAPVTPPLPMADRTSCVLGHSHIRSSLVQDPDAPKRVSLPAFTLFLSEKCGCEKGCAGGRRADGNSWSWLDRHSLERR